MTARVEKLRKQSLETQTSITPERAILITEFYRSHDALTISAPMRRALAFKYLMEHKAVCINDGELIIGERGPGPRATPTFPEICCHTVEELEILNSREKVAYAVSEETKRIYREQIIPYWKGKTIREKIFEEMTDEWKAAYRAGVFTEFMEQRAPGHTALDEKIYLKGFLGFKKEIQEQLDRLDYLNDPEAYEKQEQLKAMAIAADAIIRYAERHAQLAREMARNEADPIRKRELEQIAEICSYVPANPPRTFWEALQAYWFTHVGVISELNTWDAICPGRFDQHLYPFYQRDIESGILTREDAKELLQCFWIKFNNQPAPPKVGVTAQESGTYNDFALISLAGQTREGKDGTNELSFLCLDVLEELRLVQPHCCIQLSQQNPDRLLKRGLEVIRTGLGQPSIFNADAVVQELIRQGKSIEDARMGGTSGCVETGALGKENYNLTGYFNMMKVLEITLNNGVDPRTGEKIGLETGDAAQFDSFEQLFDAYKKQLRHFIDIKIRGNNIIEKIYAQYMPTPFLSLLISDCIQRGKDYHNGGARYNTSYIQGVGLGSITDAMASLKYNVFDHRKLSMAQMLQVLRDNFEGHENIRQMMLHQTPKYGNDDDYADALMKRLFDAYFEAIDSRKNMKGGTYRINLLPTTVHVYFGSVVGATPDGRKAGEVLSEGVSPVQGADRNGPTAVIKSVAKIDHLRTGGTLLNQKFTPSLLNNDSGIAGLSHLVRSYFKMNGHHIQFNVVTAATLRAAQQHPEKYRDLIVRVAGYSDYFCNLNKGLQDEIIARTEHQSF